MDIQTTTATTTVGTDYRGNCDTSYNTWGNGVGNHVELLLAFSAQDCCQKCQRKSNCVASAYLFLICEHLVNSKKVSGEDTSKQCSLGIENFPFGSPDKHGLVYAGPCGV